MENLITVMSLQGQAWAVAQNGLRRELKVGDTVAVDEMVITADGAQIDLQFANNQVLTLIGEQEAPVDVAQVAQETQFSQPLTVINEQQEPPSAIAAEDTIAKEGHRFVQLVRIHEIIESDGFTPLTVARIQEIIKPLGMLLPERDFEQDRWKEHVSYREHSSSREYQVSINIDVIADDDIINAAEAERDITVTGTVGGDVKPGDKVTVTVNGKTYNTTVNPDGKTWAVDVPGSELVQDTTVEATVTGNTPTGQPITADTERPYEVDTEEPVLSRVPDQDDEDSDIIDLDLREHFTDNKTPEDELNITVAGLPEGLEYDPNTGKVIGKIDKSASQNGPNNDGKFPIKVTVTDKAGNTSEIEFEWKVTNPEPIAQDDKQTIDEDTIATGNVLTGKGNDDLNSGKDYDPDGDDIRVKNFTVNGNTYQPGDTAEIPDVGEIILKGNGDYTFTPVPNWNGDVPVIDYIITDDEGGEDSAKLKIVVAPVDDPVEIDGIPNPNNSNDPAYPQIDPNEPNDPARGDTNDHVVFESGLNNGSSPNDDDLIVKSNFKITAADGLHEDEALVFGFTDIDGNPDSLTLTKSEVEELGATAKIITTQYGQLVLNGYTENPDGTLSVDYEYLLQRPPAVDTDFVDDIINVTGTDSDQHHPSDTDSKDIVIRIIDDVPVAENDENTVPEGSSEPVDGNLIAGDAGQGKDTEGADGAIITKVTSSGASTGIEVPTDGSYVIIQGEYGKLAIKDDGSYSYQRDSGTPGGVKDVFDYTLTDGDGDVDTAILTIDIADAGVSITDLTPKADGGDATVYEGMLTGGTGVTDGLGADGDKTADGTFKISSPDGIKELSITQGADTYKLIDNNGAFTPKEITTTLGNMLNITTYDASTGVVTYTYTLTSKEAHADGEGRNDLFEDFTVNLEDMDGDTTTGALSVRIVDDIPVAKDDTDTVVAGQYTAEEGNVITGVGTNEGPVGTGVDIEGADAASVTKVQFAAAEITVPETGQASIEGEYGTLLIEANGDYSYTRKPNTPGGLTDKFTYTLTDGDGDEDIATLTINIEDSAPEITELTPALEGGELTVNEKYLADGTAPDASELTETGDFKITSGDGVKSLAVTDKEGNAITVIDEDGLTGTLSVETPSGTLAITGYNPSTGVVEYSYTLTGRLEHPDAGRDSLFEDITLILTDYDNDIASGTLSVKIIDDAPLIDATTEEPMLEVDETTLADPASVDFSDMFAPHYGADGADSVNYPDEYTLLVNDGDASGLVDTVTGENVLLYKTAAGIEGRVGGESGAVAFKLSVAADGKVTLTQSSAVKHLDPNDPNDKLTLKDSGIELQLKIIDADGDTATESVDVGKFIGFRDDGPTLQDGKVDQDGFVIGNASVDEQHLPSGSASDTIKLTVTKILPINFGADGAVNSSGETGLTFNAGNITALEALELKSGTKLLNYEISTDDYTITAKTDGKPIFTITLSVAADGTPSYAFTLQGPLDHILNADGDITDNIVLPFDITATDGDGDSVALKFKVEVVDDTPNAAVRELEVNEDGSVSFNNADVNETTTSVTSDPAHGTITIGNDGTISYAPNEDYRGEDSYTYTVITDGGTYERTVDITVKPVADKPLFADESGDYPLVGDINADGSLKAGDYNYSVITPEDEPILLKLNLPKIKDDAGTTASDHSELLGAITLTPTGAGYVDDAKLQTGSKGLTPDADGKITIVITGGAGSDQPLDGYHVKGSTIPAKDESNGVYYLTEDEYEAITAHPAEDHHENFDVEVLVKSYEVNATGTPLADADVGGTNGAESTQTITVDVHAVTDDIALKIKEDDTQAGVSVVISNADKTADITFAEDTSFNLTSILAPDAFKDIDGSETRYLGLKGLPNGTTVTVGGVDYVIGQESTPTVDFGGAIGVVPALTLAGTETSLPNIVIMPPKDLSGDLDDVEVILAAQDSDSDSAVTSEVLTDSVIIKLHINPVAGDVAIEDTEGLEDTAIQFLGNIKVTDSSTADGTLGEVITKVSFITLSDGWTRDAGADSWSNADGQTWAMAPSTTSTDKWTGTWDGNTYTITFTDGSLTKDAREDILKEFTVTPPAHSSKDIAFGVEVTSVDHSIISGGSSSDPVNKTETLTVVVRPVAEKVETDTNTDGEHDLKLGGDHVYQTTGEEDEWFVLGDEASTSFKLSAGWSNEDGKWVGGSDSWTEDTAEGRSEDTFALLTPYMTVDNDARHDLDNPTSNLSDMLEGSVFTYSDGTTTFTIPFAGEPVKIPMQYLDSVQFKGPQDWSGVVKIKVQAGTIDYDEDDGTATKLEVSGESWLTNLIINPKADQVTLKVDAIIKTNEDTSVGLNIIPTSSDKAETFNVTIEGIPVGAKITYDGVEYDTLAGTLPSRLTEDGGSYTLKIEGFDAAQQPVLTLPKDSNVTINLKITAQSVDTLTYIDSNGGTQTVTHTDPSKSHTLLAEVQVQGVPDEPVLTMVQDKVYIEDAGNQDYGQLKVTLSDLITDLESGETGVNNAGPDGSETITLRISGLPEGFGLENAGPALGGSGESRVWVIKEADLATVQIVVPQHYSGAVNFTAQPVVTENDNPSKVFFDPQNVKFSITPVPEATLSISSNLIEDTIGELQLMPVGNDPDEYISEVRIAETDVIAAEVTLYDGNGNSLTASGGYYTVTNTGTTGAPVIKIKGPANFSGSKQLNIEYKVTDPSQDPIGEVGRVEDVTSDWKTEVHTLNFSAETDKIELALDAIAGGATDTDNWVTTLEQGSTVTVGLKITQKNDANANNTPDADGSEKYIHVVVSGVPSGVSVKGAVETAQGKWLLTVGGAEGIPFDTAELTQSLEFVVSGYAGSFEQAITITTYTQDTGAASLEEDSVSWTLNYVNVNPDPIDLPELELIAQDIPQAEDTPFQLGDVVTGTIISTGDTTDNPFEMTVAIRTTPDDETVFAGMTRALVTENGQQVALWTKTISTVTKADGEAKLKDLLDSITVTPAKDANSNNIDGGTFNLDVNVAVHADGVSRDAKATSKLEIKPVTDDLVITVSNTVVDEGENISLNISLSSKGGADGELDDSGAGWTVVDGQVFIHIADGLQGELYVEGIMNSGSSTAPANVPTGLSGGKYYQVAVADLDKLEFRPDTGSVPFQTGTPKVTVWVEHTENNDAAGSKVSAGEGSLNIQKSNSGYEADIIAKGDEVAVGAADSAAIELDFGADAGLIDSAESVSAAYISGLPSGFTVYMGANAASSSMANNAGENTWAIPVTGGELPAYIAILPPSNWSGSLSGVTLTVLSGHMGLTPTPTVLPIEFEVTPVASGIMLNPTLSFGDAGELIALNLNASMKDPVKATGAEDDAHTERTELTLSGFTGGDKVLFYTSEGVGDGTLDGRVAKDGSDKYIISGLSQDELDSLKFVHGTTSGPEEISISARTYELDTAGVQVGGYSDPATGAMKINISSVVATSGDDVFLWEGGAINGFGGVDTVQLRFGDDLGSADFAKLENIEIIDMQGAASGNNSITGLTPEDVFNMTDDNNLLKILGNNHDSVGLDASWETDSTAGNTTTYSYTGSEFSVSLEVTLVD